MPNRSCRLLPTKISPGGKSLGQVSRGHSLVQQWRRIICSVRCVRLLKVVVWPKASLNPASVCGRRAGKWSAGGEERLAERSRSATPPPSRRRKPAAHAACCKMPLVTSARFEQRNRRGREGDGGGRKPVQRSKPGVGHGGVGSLRGAPARDTRNENPRPFSNGSTRGWISKTA